MQLSRILTSCFVFCVSFSTLGVDTRMYVQKNKYSAPNRTYTVRKGEGSYCMHGVYNPGIAHIKGETVALLRIHWDASGKCAFHQSYQDFIVSADDYPDELRARVRWYRPVFSKPYVTVFGDYHDLVCKHKYDSQYGAITLTIGTGPKCDAN